MHIQWPAVFLTTESLSIELAASAVGSMLFQVEQTSATPLDMVMDGNIDVWQVLDKAERAWTRIESFI
jgi:hypothetical protein